MPRERNVRKWLAVWSLAAAASAPGATAQNAIDNAEFDDAVETEGWIPLNFSEWTYAPNDADGCDLSGGGYGASMASLDPERPRYFYVVSPGCLALTPGQEMHIDLRYLAPGVEVVRPLLLMYSTPDCTGSTGGFYFWNLGGTTEWTRASLSGTNSANAAYVRLAIDAWNTTTTDFSLVFDRVYLGVADRLFADGFEGGTTACRWSP